MKRVLVILLIIMIAVGWTISVTGVQMGAIEIEPINKQMKLGLDLKGGVYVVLEAKTDAQGDELKELMTQTQQVIERRVNAMGLSEPTVIIEGDKRVRIDLPGVKNASEAIASIGKTAQLEFTDYTGKVILTGKDVKDAGIIYQQDNPNEPVVSLDMTGEGADAFQEATYQMSLIPMPSKTDPNYDEDIIKKIIYIVLDGEVISAPVVNDEIRNGNGVIEGGFTIEEAATLAALIRGGALPVNLEEIQTSVIGPTLGINSLNQSVFAGMVGIALILLFMVLYYRLPGLSASIALLLYILTVIWILIGFDAVLTLPGAAGLILSIGMAVDANVIIFERIKEEIRNGKSIRVSINSGFKRALTTILDANVTTIIAGVVLYQFGSGPVKGFAVTLMIGILVSLLTAVLITRLFLSVFSEIPAFNKAQYFGVNHKKFNLQVTKNSKRWYSISVIIIVVGLLAGTFGGFNLGIDFSGGTMIHINMNHQAEVADIKDTIKEYDLNETIVHVGNEKQEIIIKTKKSLSNAERSEIFDAIASQYDLTQEDLLAADQFSPAIGNEIREKALIAVLVASIGMLIYITVRFEIKFAVAAIIALIHDIGLMIVFYGIFRIPINSPFIAAILIVVGYSINDTIVVFDRIRENIRINKKMKHDKIVDMSINQTLSRSINTSATTLIAILCIYIFGVESIREFTLPLIAGVLSGTYSSIFIASPVWYHLNKLVNKPKYAGK